MTGLYPQQTGVGWMVDQTVQPVGYERALNDSCVTIAEALRGAAGYRTLMSGKWHVGEERGNWPVRRGFDRSFALINALSNYFGVYGSYPTNETITGQMRRIEQIERVGIWAMDDKPFTPPADGSFYSTDAVTDNAVKYLDEYGRARAPFFLYVAYPAPHWPLHAPPEEIAKYQDKYRTGWDAARQARQRRLLDLGFLNPRWQLPPRDERVPAWSDAGRLDAWAEPMRLFPRSDGQPSWNRADDRGRWAQRMAVYAAQVDRMDQGIGRILAKLKEVGADEKTLVLFLSDNGADAYRVDRGVPEVEPGGADSFTSYGVPWAQVSTTPFRDYKARTYEGGIATPFIARYKNVIKPGTITNQIGHIIDIMATALDAAGVPYPTAHKGRRITPLEGKSLLPVFRGGRRAGRDAEHRTLYWEHEGNRAVRRGKWKLVADFNKKWELYDLAADRTEQHNLAAKYPTKVKELAAAYDAWTRKANVALWSEFAKR